MSIHDKHCGCCRKEPSFSWVPERNMWVCKKCFDQIELQESTPEFREDVRAVLTGLLADPNRDGNASAYVKTSIELAEEIERQLKERGRL